MKRERLKVALAGDQTLSRNVSVRPHSLSPTGSHLAPVVNLFQLLLRFLKEAPFRRKLAFWDKLLFSVLTQNFW